MAVLQYKNGVIMGISVLVVLFNFNYSRAGWETETVDAINWVGEYTSLVLDESGNPRISYYDETNHDVKYAFFESTNGTTTPTTITTTTTSSTSICFLEWLFGEDSEAIDCLINVREACLNNSPEGREITRLYYQWSPFLISTIGGDEELQKDIKAMVGGFLQLVKDGSD